MIADGSREIPGLPLLTYIDVQPGSPASSLESLISIHLEHFGASYSHLTVDFTRTWCEGSLEPEVIEHQWLLLVDGEAAGEFVFHTNLRRRVIARYHLALNSSARSQLPAGWISALVDAAINCAMHEAAGAGTVIYASFSEISRRHVSGWKSLGYISPEIDYREPLHGSYWADHGELAFNPLHLNVKILPQGVNLPLSEVVEAGVRAFLIDYYRLPASNSVVTEILRNCARLSPSELSEQP